MRIRTRRPAALLLGLGLVVLPLSACGSSKKSTDTTVAAAADTTAAPADTAAADTTAAPADSAAPETTVATGEAPSDTTAAGASTETTAAAAAPADTTAGASTSGADLAAGLAAFGITDEKDLKCVQDAAGDINLSGSEPPAKFIKALITCAPDAMAVAAVPSIKESAPELTDDQAKCIVKLTFEKINEIPENELAQALSGDIPKEIKDKVRSEAKKCGVDDAILAKALEDKKQ